LIFSLVCLRNFIFLLRKSYLGERVTFGWLFSFTLTQRRTFNMPNTVTALAQMADQAASADHRQPQKLDRFSEKRRPI
jgi:hypothetical protein